MNTILGFDALAEPDQGGGDGVFPLEVCLELLDVGVEAGALRDLEKVAVPQDHAVGRLPLAVLHDDPAPLRQGRHLDVGNAFGQGLEAGQVGERVDVVEPDHRRVRGLVQARSSSRTRSYCWTATGLRPKNVVNVTGRFSVSSCLVTVSDESE